MSKSVSSVIDDLRAIIFPYTGTPSMNLAYNRLGDALTWLADPTATPLNVKLANPPDVVLDLVKE